MNSSLFLTGAFAMATSLLAADAPARRERPRPVVSPEIQSDHKVTFRVQAPKAGEVTVSGQWGATVKMTRGENDVWEATVGPVEPGVYEYSFSLDGFRMIDPGNSAIKPMRQPRTSILHIPGEPPLIHDFQSVPHGGIHEHTYASKSLGRLREMVVYTPPGYDQHPDTRYPTLYLQHGSGDNQATWVVHGKAHWIFDNLIAQGRARPMVVVMMDGHASIGGGQGNTPAFESDLIEDVMPFIEANYRVKADRENRGIVGLSMGGGQSLTIGLSHLDRFAWVGGFSSSVPASNAVAATMNHPEAANRALKLLWIGCGKDDFLLSRNEAFIASLKEKGIRHDWHLTEGNHSWPIWRGYLAEFTPKLFR
ncbi:MAG: alpha/beta hydrolase-fold protein [Verrucomicrobia bacterium]|nr:alpha/beta hydrolase-fold protein [Verrucomicrobiota bacterium]